MKTNHDEIAQERRSSVFIGALLLTAFFSFLLSCGHLYADVVRLKNGRALEGEVLEKTDKSVVIKTKVAKVTVDTRNISSIEEKALPEDFFAKKTSKAKEGKKTAKEAETVQEEEKTSKPLLALEAKYFKNQNTSAEFVDVEGTTCLPDKALIYIFLKRLDSYIVTGKAVVKDGRFSMTFGPFEKQIPSGNYNVDADFILEKQSEEVLKQVQKDKDNKKLELIHSSCPLTVEKPGTGEAEVKAELESVVFELKALYNELDKVYHAHKAKFDARAWDEWSGIWVSRVRAEKSKIEQRSLKGFSLFPDSEERLEAAATTLLNLHAARSIEFKDPKGFARRRSDPKARAGPEMLIMCFEDDLNRVLKEIESCKE